MDGAIGKGLRRDSALTASKWRVSPGEVVGLWRDNGAGKSTNREIIAGNSGEQRRDSARGNAGISSYDRLRAAVGIEVVTRDLALADI